MISSMTAYASYADQKDWGAVTWEVRSVNHRFLDITLKLPDTFRDLEIDIRDLVKQFLHRGKVDITMKFQPGAAAPVKLHANQFLVDQYLQLLKQMQHSLAQGTIDLVRLLSVQGVVETQSDLTADLKQKLLTPLQQALQSMVEARLREGEKIKETVEERLAWIEKTSQDLQQLLPAIQQVQRDKITTRIAELNVEYDNDRLEQELVYLANKSDVHEELDRLQMHVAEMRRVLNEEQAAGRRLDFLTQELHREANTLGSKSINNDMSQLVVDLKVKIEQIREQVQNIE